jgi:hypothetical protein
VKKTGCNAQTAIALATALAFVGGAGGCDDDDDDDDFPAADGAPRADAAGTPVVPDPVKDDANRLIDEGRATFRFDTFGDEAFWGNTIKLHRAIAGAANGGVGPGLSPAAALMLGLKVDVELVPDAVARGIQNGTVDLNDPANTLALLQANAVIGVIGRFDGQNQLTSVGITCALCHTDVDNSFAAGIGKRRDGWANRDLDVGKIVALAPNLAPVAQILGVDVPTVRTVLESWGPGKYDAILLMDGKAFRPDGRSAATLIPPAFGLAGINLHTSTGWGSVTYWNAFVANTQMHGQGTFYDPRLDDPVKYPIAAANRFGHVRNEVDLISAKLPALHAYQIALVPPAAPGGSFDPTAAARGATLFAGKADCGRCHTPGLYSEPGWNMHTGEEIGIDNFQAARSPDNRYRTAPLRGLWSHVKGGFYHDGRFATLLDVIEHYDGVFDLALTAQEKADLAEYLKSL